MPKFTGRIHGTFEDEFEVEAATEEEARELALEGWQYTEFVDLEVHTIHEERE